MKKNKLKVLHKSCLYSEAVLQRCSPRKMRSKYETKLHITAMQKRNLDQATLQL